MKKKGVILLVLLLLVAVGLVLYAFFPPVQKIFASFGVIIIKLSGTVSLLILVSYFLNRWLSFGKMLDSFEKRLESALMTGVIGGLFGIYGTFSSVAIQGAMVSVRDIGPMMAGVFGGPVAGLVAGLIAGVQRFTMGGVTQIPCSVATITIGIFCGLLMLPFRDKLKKPIVGAILGGGMEVWHLALVLMITKPFSLALSIVQSVFLPFILMNGIGFGLMLYVLQMIKKRNEEDLERERLGAELDLAKNIQASLLPCIFPAFPGREEFDLYATMMPAKEVGGDFYDFFLVDDDHLAVVMADVSGKGVPAALFMVVAKTLLKDLTQTGIPPKQVIEKANAQLCEGNEEEMFVTVWLGVLQISTGKMTCVNAGHEYPAVKRIGDGFQLVKDKHGFVLAGMPNVQYREYELQLKPGDVLFLYTDGVAEATDGHNELFGTDRMLNALNSHPDDAPGMLLKSVQANIDAFVGDAPQFDDITMLALEIRGDITDL